MWAWLPTVLSFVSSLVWPVIALAALVIFREPIADFARDVKEVSGLGVSAKRGDAQATKLRNKIDAASAIAERSPDAASAIGRSEPRTSKVLPTEAVVRFVGSMSRYRLKELGAEATEASSSGEARLIVIRAYQELVVFVRGLELAQQAENKIVKVPRYDGSYTFKSLADIGGPSQLCAALEELQTFKADIVNHKQAVSPDGALTYVNAALDILNRIYSWYTGEEAIRLGVEDLRGDPGDGPSIQNSPA